MIFLHLSDLHIGKTLNEFSLLDDQAHILDRILSIAKTHRVDSILICGDIYDRPVPALDGVILLDRFLTELCTIVSSVFIISGNHDSPERMSFGAGLMKKEHVYISPVYNGSVKPVQLEDEFGKLNIYMLPFIKPAHLRKLFPDVSIETYTDAVRVAVKNMNVDARNRNILLSHQFVTGAMRCDSEEVNVGGLDNVDASVFDDFDYTALGHIHSPQIVTSEKIRYCGSPLKYSFSEASQTKQVTLLDVREKGNVSTESVPLTPLRDMIKIRGTYTELTSPSFYKSLDRNSFVLAKLTDENDIPGAIGKLRSIYPNIMRIEYDNRRTRTDQAVSVDSDADKKTPLELTGELYELQNNRPMSERQRRIISDIIDSYEM